MRLTPSVYLALPDLYPGECPSLPPSDAWEPGPEDLEWLLGQRRDCLGLPRTLAALDARIVEVAARLWKGEGRDDA